MRILKLAGYLLLGGLVVYGGLFICLWTCKP